MNTATIIVLIIVGVAVIGVIAKLIIDKKKGKTHCSGDCSHCSGCK